jgi:dipeptidyl aminopeptidase/acylaminoacyl peptidase
MKSIRLVAGPKGLRQARRSALLPNEGHGFSKRENQIDAMQRQLDFFAHYLKGL